MKAILNVLPTFGPGISAEDILGKNILKRPRVRSAAMTFIKEWLEELVLRGQAYSEPSKTYYWRGSNR